MPLWMVSSTLYLPVWNMIVGKRKDGGKNALFSYLKTFQIPLKKLLKGTLALILYGRIIPSVFWHSVFSDRLESK